MPDIIVQSSVSTLPSPAIDISFRVATLADLPAIDTLQKKYHKQLGFFPRAQMEGYLKNGWVVVAEGRHEGQGNARSELAPRPSPLAPTLLGYCASRDRYLKRDELGVIYQLCVDPGVQRKFIGAALLRAVFERAPYGCRLFCCWCAQDIAANYFWESMGFVPLAFRTGGRGKGQKSEGKGQNQALAPDASPLAPSSRMHIFWQKRIVSGDETTPYWFPSQTGGGAIGEDRIVLPIPPDVRWSDQMPRVLPGEERSKSEIRAVSPVLPGNPKQIQSRKSEGSKPKPTEPAPKRILNGWGFAPPAPVKPAAAARVRKPRERKKNDPKLVATARELRDRWLDAIHAGEYLPAMQGKYDLGRSLGGPMSQPVGLIEAA